MRRYLMLMGLISSSATMLGCGSQPAPVALPSHAYQLSSEPENAMSVLQFKAQAENGGAVTVIGKVGGGQKPWIDGKAAFLIVDDGVAPDCQDEACGEDCAECAQALAEATTLVKFIDPATGKVANTDARELLGVQNLQTVVIRGVAAKDKAGNVSVVADGIYLRR